MSKSAAVWKMILHWGEMGPRWGISRSVAQVHALLFLSDRPIRADEMVEALGISRSNVSMCLRELVHWRLVRLVPVFDDRREHFVAETDPATMLHRIMEMRKEREFDPTLNALRDCAAEAGEDSTTSSVESSRINDLCDAFENIEQLYQHYVSDRRPSQTRAQNRAEASVQAPVTPEMRPSEPVLEYAAG